MPKPPKPATCQRPAGHRRADSALRAWPAHLRLWIIAAIALSVDLASKTWAFTNLQHEGRNLIAGFLQARRSLNAGALFGAFSGWVPAFIAASLLALAFVLYVFACSSRKQWFMHLGLSFILAGALGNLYDRTFVQTDIVTLKTTAGSGPGQDIGLIVSEPGADPVVLASYPHRQYRRSYPRNNVESITRHGVVRDFIKFTPLAGFDYWPWVFNVADALLVAGVAILMLTLLGEHRAAKAAAAKPAQAKTAP